MCNHYRLRGTEKKYYQLYHELACNLLLTINTKSGWSKFNYIDFLHKQVQKQLLVCIQPPYRHYNLQKRKREGDNKEILP